MVCTTRNVTLEDYRKFGDNCMSIRSMEVRNVIDSLIRNDKDELAADIRTRKYYRQERLWK